MILQFNNYDEINPYLSGEKQFTPDDEVEINFAHDTYLKFSVEISVRSLFTRTFCLFKKGIKAGGVIDAGGGINAGGEIDAVREIYFNSMIRFKKLSCYRIFFTPYRESERIYWQEKLKLIGIDVDISNGCFDDVRKKILSIDGVIEKLHAFPYWTKKERLAIYSWINNGIFDFRPTQEMWKDFFSGDNDQFAEKKLMTMYMHHVFHNRF